MSTRCMINFGYHGRVDAKVYQHSDGYPDGENGVLCKLERFFRAVEADTKDTRFGDPEYLAAKFLVWASQESRLELDEVRKEWGGTPSGGPLDFLGYGISMEDHGDEEYVYFVECGDRPALVKARSMADKRAKFLGVPNLKSRRPVVKVTEPTEPGMASDGWAAVKPAKLDAKAKKALKLLDRPKTAKKAKKAVRS